MTPGTKRQTARSRQDPGQCAGPQGRPPVGPLLRFRAPHRRSRGVADILRGAGADEQIHVAGLLHDVIEDTPRSVDDVRAMFAERARRELLATGQTVRKRRDPTVRDQLTLQEQQIARLARDGLSNPGDRRPAFSERIVEWHLRKVFAQLDINSRRALKTALRDSGR